MTILQRYNEQMTVPRRSRWRPLVETARALALAKAPKPERLEPRRILVVGYAAIGDLLFFLPVLEGLRRRWPQARLTFLANAYPTTQELLPATGLAEEIWTHDWEGPGAGDQGEINARIAAGGFDLAVLSLASPAHYFETGLRAVPARAGHWRALDSARRALALGEYARRALVNVGASAPTPGEHALARNLRLLDALDVEHEPAPKPTLELPLEARTAAEARLRAAGVSAEERLLAVHLGAPNNQYDKMWAPERFGELCRRLAEGTRARFVLLGGADERPSAAAARRAFPGLVDLTGQLSLLQTFAVLARGELLIANDTGLTKAAMVLGTPTATLWGPSDPREYGAVWEREKHLDIRTGISCSPCSFMGMARPGALNYANCGHHDCLRKLEVAFAEAALRGRFGLLFSKSLT